MRIDPKRYQDMPCLQRAALGLEAADLAIVNGKIVNVITRQCYEGEVFIKNGVIVHVESDPSKFAGKDAKADKVYDAKGGYIAPGFMDAHVHCESSMMTPYEFLRTISVHGTTAVFTDPHEIGNVCGIEGVKFMLSDDKDAPIRQFVLAPSSVPAVPGIESTGAAFFAKEVGEIFDLDKEKVVGLAEVMDYPNVISGEKRMRDILDEARNRDIYIQAHYSGLFGRELSSYLLASNRGGNHELRTKDEMRAVIKNGGRVDIRGGSSIGDNFEMLLEALSEFPNFENMDTVTFCTDDVHAKDLHECHINKTVARAIKWGLDPITAIRYCSYNVAREYGIVNLGAVAADNLADLVVLPDLISMEPTAVFLAGEMIAESGKLIKDKPNSVQPPKNLVSTMNIKEIKKDDLLIRVPDASKQTALVNVMKFDGMIGSELETIELPVKDGAIDLSANDDLAFAAVFNRYGTGGKTVAVIRNFNLRRGAGATTVSHDSHNLTAVYKDLDDAVKVLNAIIDAGGGIGACVDGEMKIVPLPVGGLMSRESAAELSPKIDASEQLLNKMSRTGSFSLLALATLALPVIPDIRITDIGLVDVLQQKTVPLFAE